MLAGGGGGGVSRACLLAAVVPVAAASPDPRPAAARAVVQRYYRAIERGDYRAAWRQWDRGGAASGQSLDAFTRGFARTAHVRVTAGAPTDDEGAAGSAFVTVPVRVDAVLKDGTHQRFAGRYVLRRVNGVDGATRDQLGWHIDSAALRRVR